MKKIIKVKYTLLVLIIEISTLLLVLVLAYNFISMPKKKTTFFLPSSNIDLLLETLDKHGFHTYFIDKYAFKFITLPTKGWYSIGNTEEGRIKFFKSLHLKQSKTMQVKLYAGETSVELSKRLANDMKLNPNILLDLYKQQSVFEEAGIFSGRYTLAREADENTTMSYLFDTSNDVLKIFSSEYCKMKVKLFIASKIINQAQRQNLYNNDITMHA